MADIDLNLLIALDALLAEGSVAGAARRLGLSASATSRTLARLRAATGDPLLVRAGRGMVPTPHATELRERVRDLAQSARSALRPAAASLDLAELKRTFTIRSNEGFVEVFAAQLVAAVAAVAPNVRLHFAPKPDKDVRALREGLVDLEIGVLGSRGQRYAYKPYSATTLFVQFGRATLFLGEARSRPSDTRRVVTLSLRAVVTRVAP